MHFKPHHVIFLGDMTASGRRAVSDEEWVPFFVRCFLRLIFVSIYAFRYGAYYETFTRMFPIPLKEATPHYLPGNNDVGLNMDPIESQHARRRFTKHFGPLDQTVVIQNHTLVLLDASRIIEEDYRRLRGGPNHEFPKDGTMSFVGSLSPGSLLILAKSVWRLRHSSA